MTYTVRRHNAIGAIVQEDSFGIKKIAVDFMLSAMTFYCNMSYSFSLIAKK